MSVGRALALAAVLVVSCTASAHAGVNAADYDSFWLWGGVRPRPLLARARTVYVLQGQIGEVRPRPGRSTRLVAQGIPVARLRSTEVWLVYRANTLEWPSGIDALIAAQVRRWRHAGTAVAGIQIDFDAATRHLDRYSEFLRGLRRRLPADCKLGVTGLLDWTSQADPETLADLRGTIDEIVVQTYQGRRSIPDAERYLPHLERLRIPFKVGLVEGGEWSAPPGLAGDPWFRGYVIFLRNAGPPPPGP